MAACKTRPVGSKTGVPETEPSAFSPEAEFINSIFVTTPVPVGPAKVTVGACL